MAAGQGTPNIAVGPTHLSSRGRCPGAARLDEGLSQAAVWAMVRAAVFWKLSLAGPLPG